MFSNKRRINRFTTKVASSNRRKRMLANNKKKIIWRHRAFVQNETFE